ncbi:MAG: hypothetical protein A2015_06605 [Spirochaetes bacterium GWF1_31_7]|nr:MAG: hypothetical protein A2Y30_09855 [Spirochaetes bacterium GWE1_32_154]OHD46511.1 MAG: hypothetical protein A2015_06605 [Spirochaetes bacterium GWF1_31_7]OHD49320.1 MAG: hypothetical protein A2Y29_03600 [Spirochaetes bacterium GWE2_31_10]OHD76977.1 MAG: hypothetical protein A2355_04535 [Spirochaetes bacterium RIFOXYB1_FULL_32_8]
MLKKILIFSFLVVCIALPLIPSYFYCIDFFDSLFEIYTFSMVSGIFSYYYFIIVLIISARIKLLDILFGHDKVMMFHGILASIAFLSSILHFILKISISFSISFQTITGGIALSIFAIVIIITLLFMANPFIRIHWKSKIIDYSKVKCFHNFSVIASVSMIIHVNIASSTINTPGKQLSMIVIGAVAILLYIYHAGIRLIIQKINKYTVVSVDKLTDSITKIVFKRVSCKNTFFISKFCMRLPLMRLYRIWRKHKSSNLDLCKSLKRNKNTIIKRNPGQFAFFRFKSKAVGFEEHPFTISSETQTIFMSITVKKSGDYTAQLSNIIVGDSLYFDGPYGVFSPIDNGSNYVFIAGGIGITPFISILKSFSKSVIRSNITLIWSVRNVSDLFENELFEKIQKDNSNFTYIPLVDTDITETFISTIKALDKPSVYFCGPPLMNDFIKLCIKNQKLRIHNFYYERFSL